jgi:hypothetical protein
MRVVARWIILAKVRARAIPCAHDAAVVIR